MSIKKEKGSFCMKNVIRKITMILLSTIVMVTMLPFYSQAAEWYPLPLGIDFAYAENGLLIVDVAVYTNPTNPTESFYLKLTCVEDATERYCGTYLADPGDTAYTAITGHPMLIEGQDSPVAGALGDIVELSVIFTGDIVETGKHYTVQLVYSTNGGNTYTAMGPATSSIEIVNTPVTPPVQTPAQTPAQTTEAPKPVVPKHPYWWECRNEIKELGKSSEPETLVYEEGTALPIEIMEALQECPNVTLIFKCCYNDTDYEFTISGEEAIVISDIPWYGPLWLNQYYSE